MLGEIVAVKWVSESIVRYQLKEEWTTGSRKFVLYTLNTSVVIPKIFHPFNFQHFPPDDGALSPDLHSCVESG